MKREIGSFYEYRAYTEEEKPELNLQTWIKRKLRKLPVLQPRLNGQMMW